MKLTSTTKDGTKLSVILCEAFDLPEELPPPESDEREAASETFRRNEPFLKSTLVILALVLLSEPCEKIEAVRGMPPYAIPVSQERPPHTPDAEYLPSEHASPSTAFSIDVFGTGATTQVPQRTNASGMVTPPK
jgi:hypothetical protein